MIRKPTPTRVRQIMTGTALVNLALTALAGSDPAVATSGTAAGTNAVPSSFFPQLEKPAWLTDLSVGVKETYDDNVLLVSGDGPMKPKESLVTSANAKVGFNFAPLIGEQPPIDLLTLIYNPEIAAYHNLPSENYNVQRINDAFKGSAGELSYNFDNAFSYVDGNDQAPIYLGDDKYRSGFASVVAKERRKQIQERSKATLQYDWDSFFVRPTASLLYYDMMTDFSSTAGYQNYPSRADVNGGSDFGYRLTPGLAVTLGYRYGHQYQQMLPESIDATQKASGSDYQRALVGFEGKPWHWLTFAAQAGPDFRNYVDTAAIADRNDVTYYSEASATADITANDSLALKYKQWRFVAYSGRVPYFDSNYELAYRRKLTEKVFFDLAGRVAEYDFTCGSDPKASNERDDFLFSVSPGLTFVVNHNLSLNVSGSIDLGRNAYDNPPGGADYREFDHTVASVGATYKF